MTKATRRWGLLLVVLAAGFGAWVIRDAARLWHARGVAADAGARLSDARLDLAQQKLESAFLHFQTLAELHPGDQDAWLGLARVYLAAEMPWAGEVAATRAIEAAPAPDAEALLVRAQLRAQLHRNFSAALDAQAALKADPASAEARALLSRVNAAAPQAPAVPPPRERFWPGRLADYVHQVPESLQKRDWDGAMKIAARAGQEYPGAMIGPWLAGIANYAQGKFPEAEVELKKALIAAPRSSRVVTNLAGAWAKQNGPLPAAGQLLKLQQEDPGFVVPLDIAATAYLEARQPAAAERALRAGTSVASAPPRAFLQLSDFYESLDRPAEALAACNEGLARAPANLELLLRRAALQASLAQEAAAVAGYEEILKSRPDAMAARGALARLLIERDDAASRQRAAALVDGLQRDAPDSADVLDAAGWVLARQGQGAKARAWLAVAAQLAPGDAVIRYHYGALLAQLKERDAARRELDAALAAGPFAQRLEAQALLKKL